MVNTSLDRFKKAALDLVFPRWCVGCGREGSYICSRCSAALPWITPPVCERCGYPLREADQQCPDCADWPSYLDGVSAPFRFEGIIRKAVHQLKYHNLKALSEELGGLLADHLAACSLPGDVLVAVPIHPHRRRERGYNQSHLLAASLSKNTGRPLLDGVLVRCSETLSQARTADVAQRWRNTTDAFTCNSVPLAGRSILLIDDVVTTGATINAAASALKTVGATVVYGLAMAREI